MTRDLAADSNYDELSCLGTQGISRVFLVHAASWLRTDPEVDEEPCRASDLRLLALAKASPLPQPLLCLRCRVSHPLAAWLRATYNKYRVAYGLDLLAMASYALDDSGSLSIRTGLTSERPFIYAEISSMPKGLISPFTAEVIRTYDSEKCGLPHWARLKLQCHNELKAYFRENGLLLISDWALLADSSAKRVRDSWELFGRGGFTADFAVSLCNAYKPLYREAMQTHRLATGKASGWQPDTRFLRALMLHQPEAQTMEQLEAIAASIRRLQSGRWQTSSTLDLELAEQVAAPQHDSDSAENSAHLRRLIDQALQRAMDAHMPAVISAAGTHRVLLRCLWSGWAGGMSNRPLAEHCGTSCGTVSKKLRPTEHASTIATAAALELLRHDAFASCGQSVEGADRLVAALRNQLLESEREGVVAPMRRWIQQYLSES